jgi:hypothetical protein
MIYDGGINFVHQQLIAHLILISGSSVPKKNLPAL